jgi:hypothetical protein
MMVGVTWIPGDRLVMMQEIPGRTDRRLSGGGSFDHTGFSVHNQVRVEPEDQPAMERLARYVMRLPIS